MRYTFEFDVQGDAPDQVEADKLAELLADQLRTFNGVLGDLTVDVAAVTARSRAPAMLV